ESICFKCLEKAPLYRYQTAQQLADDLRRFVRGEAVSARPLGFATRAFRWARRRPVVAGLSSALAATVLVGMLLLTYSWRRESAQRILAERREAVAERAVNDILHSVSEHSFRDVPEGDRVRELLLEKALAFYEQWAAEEPESMRRQWELSRSLHRVANIYALR